MSIDSIYKVKVVHKASARKPAIKKQNSTMIKKGLGLKYKSIYQIKCGGVCSSGRAFYQAEMRSYAIILPRQSFWNLRQPITRYNHLHEPRSKTGLKQKMKADWRSICVMWLAQPLVFIYSRFIQTLSMALTLSPVTGLNHAEWTWWNPKQLPNVKYQQNICYLPYSRFLER